MHLGVRRPSLPMPPLSDDAAVTHDDRTDERIRARPPFGMVRDAQCLAHVHFIQFILQRNHLAFLLKEVFRDIRATEKATEKQRLCGSVIRKRLTFFSHPDSGMQW